MKRMIKLSTLVAIVLALIIASGNRVDSRLLAQDLEVVSTSPASNAVDVATTTQIDIVFTEPINPATVNTTNIAVYSSFFGRCTGFCWVDGETATFMPSTALEPGDLITVTVTTEVAALSGANLSAPWVWTFMVETAEAPGTFEHIGTYDVGEGVGVMCCADFTEDRIPDVAVGDWSSDSLFIYLSDGDGALSEGQRIGNLGSVKSEVEAGDIDSDGDNDLIAICASQLYIYANDGFGSFTLSSTIDLDECGSTGCITDLNGDGHMDLAIGCQGGFANHLTILLNDGTGQFPSASVYEFSGDEKVGYDMIDGDFDLDGDIDLLGAREQAVLFLNDGQGAFTTTVTSPMSTGNFMGTGGDFDDDGLMDFAVANQYDFAAYLNDGDNTFSLSWQWAPVIGAVWDTDAMDIDGDGHLDLGIAGGFDSLVILMGEGNGQFLDPIYFYSGDYSQQVAFADLDGDSDIDAIVGNRISQDLWVLINRYCADTDGDGYGDPYHPENECPEDNCPVIYNPDQIDLNENGLGDACEFSEKLVGGSSEWVSFDGSGVGLDFPYVFPPGGDVTLEIMTCGLGVHPAGFQVAGVNMPLCYDITADFSFTPPVIVCIDYDDTGMTEAQEDAIVMQHWFGFDWMPMPEFWLDTELNIICSETNSFSIFAVTFPIPYSCGDADASGEVDIDDVVYLIAYIFSGGPEPVPYESGDANCAGGVDIDDVVYLIAYIFSGGNAPCDTDGDEVPDC